MYEYLTRLCQHKQYMAYNLLVPAKFRSTWLDLNTTLCTFVVPSQLHTYAHPDSALLIELASPLWLVCMDRRCMPARQVQSGDRYRKMIWIRASDGPCKIVSFLCVRSCGVCVRYTACSRIVECVVVIISSNGFTIIDHKRVYKGMNRFFEFGGSRVRWKASWDRCRVMMSESVGKIDCEGVHNKLVSDTCWIGKTIPGIL